VDTLADVTESDDAFHVEIELPGVKSKDIDVEPALAVTDQGAATRTSRSWRRR
jgi:hypothetical protein